MEILLEGVRKTFDGLLALDRVDLSIPSGRIVAVLGANGAGKTTFLRLLATVLRPSRGRILLDREILTRARLDLRRRLLYLPDFPVFLPAPHVIGHLGMLARLYERDPRGLEERGVELLADLDLLAVAEARGFPLSRGQAYKASLAGLLLLDPDLWLLDEPFASGMDPHGIAVFKREARAAARRGRTVVYTTQILELAEGFSDLAIVLHQGVMRSFYETARLRTSGGLEELLETLRSEGSPS